MFAHDLHAYVRALMGADAVRVGPFLIGFDAHDAGPFRNYAVPDDGAAPTADDVLGLVDAFVARGRVPRLEFLPEPAPGLEAVLHAGGFTTERHVPVLVCPPSEVVGGLVPDGVDVRLAATRADLEAAAEAQNEAYGVPEVAGHDVDRLQGTVDRGGLVALAVDRSDGRGVGAGLCAPPHGGVSELAAVGVRASHRRRGIAASLTALLTRSCPEVGIRIPFLTPAGADEERVYRAVGYRDATTMVHVSRPT